MKKKFRLIFNLNMQSFMISSSGRQIPNRALKKRTQKLIVIKLKFGTIHFVGQSIQLTTNFPFAFRQSTTCSTF